MIRITVTAKTISFCFIMTCNRKFTDGCFVNIRKNTLDFKYPGHFFNIHKYLARINTKKGPPRQAAPTIPWLLTDLITEFNLVPGLDDSVVLTCGLPLWAALQVFDEFACEFFVFGGFIIDRKSTQ